MKSSSKITYDNGIGFVLRILILFLFCVQNSIYTDSLWNLISFDEQVYKIVQPYRILSSIIAFLSAFVLWFVVMVIFHLSASIFSEKEVRYELLLKSSILYLLIPLISEFIVNVFLFFQDGSIHNHEELKSLLVKSPYCYFKYAMWMSYVLYMACMIKLVHYIYKIRLTLSAVSIVLSVIIWVICLIFKMI